MTASNAQSGLAGGPRPLRVLWFTPRPVEPVEARLGRPVRGSGYWIGALLEALRGRPELRLATATVCAGAADMRLADGGVEHFVIGRRRLARKLGLGNPWRRCLELADRWKPDLIHVHGTETPYGLTACQAGCPVVISLQGFSGLYRRHFWGALSPGERIAACGFSELLRGRGLAWEWWRLGRRARQERRILARARVVLGRTNWDKVQARRFNPRVEYRQVGEVLRGGFYQARWRLCAARRDSVVFTNGGSPCRGVETLLEAAALLLARRPSLSLRVAGNVRGAYGAFLRRRIARLGLSDRVRMLGYLSEGEVVEALLRSHVFVLPSHNENSPNSLAEAMLVGMPCIAAGVGGVPSMIDEGRSGLLVEPGSPAVLAERLEELLSDDGLAASLAQSARAQAMVRHAGDRVVAQLLQAYRQALGQAPRPQEVPA